MTTVVKIRFQGHTHSQKLNDEKSDLDKLLTLNSYDVTNKTFIDKSLEKKIQKLNKKNRSIPIAEKKLLQQTSVR